MGAGIQECDVTFTKDKKLVCRHSQCDLHTTTNVVAIPELNAKCTTPFKPAVKGSAAATAKCCTSDFTLDELKKVRQIRALHAFQLSRELAGAPLLIPSLPIQ